MTRNRLDSFFAPFRMLDELEREFRAANRAVPAVNVSHDEDRATATFALPGVELDAIEVEIDGTDLTVRGRREEPAIGEGQWGLRERSHGATQRMIRLPFEIDRDGVQANYRDGLLTIELPRAEADKPSRIAVTAG